MVMDLTTTTTTTTTGSPTPTKTPDTENETPPQAITITPLFFTNGVKKKHHDHHPPAPVVTYKECLKNHAASLGGHALDGCGEFMPSSPTTPTSLKCAACGCHRNFHRQELVDSNIHFLNFHRHHPPTYRSSASPPPPHRPPPLPISNNYSYAAPQMLLALSGCTAVQNEQPPMNYQPVVTPATPTAAKTENPNGRKRFRTKFSQSQKEKMLSFSEKLGWKFQKSDGKLVEEFCKEIGVGKSVLKVWMHNNKSTLGRRENINPTTSNSNGRVISFDNINTHNVNIINNNSHGSSAVHLHVLSTNGSSSSS